MPLPRVFLSHASRDKDEIQHLRKALADRGVPGWEDVLELRLGDSLGALRDAVQGADAFLLYLTPQSISSDWVHREVDWALEARRRDPAYRILPLLRGLGRPALHQLTGGAEVVSIVLEDGQAIETAVPALLQALGLAPQNATPRPDPQPAPPMAELVLEFTSPRKHTEGGLLRAAARARVSYVPAGGGRGIDGAWLDGFVAPLGPIEASELAWYLEAFSEWPFGPFKERGRKVEKSLPR